MTSVSSASSSNGAYYASQKSAFTKLDTDQDGKLTKDEFVAGRPKNISESQASTLYSKIDSKNTGSVTEDEFDDGMEDNLPSQGIESLLSSDAMAVLMLMSQQGGMSFDSGSGSFGSSQSASDLYADMDTDSNGKVTQAEFVSARPDDMSEKDATAIYGKIDTAKAGSITEEQFTEAFESRGGGMPAKGSGGSGSSDEVYDTLDVNKDGVVSQEEFLAGRPADVTDEQATALFKSLDTDGKGSITKEQFSTFANDNVDGDQLDLSSGMSVNISKGIDELLTMLQSLSSSGQTETEAA